MRINNNGNNINFIHDKAGNDTLVVMFHGLTMSSIIYPFNELAKDILKMGYDVLRFDFIGHGESYGDSKDMTFEKEILDASFMIERFRKGYKKLILLGHSQGGLVANYLASLFCPAKVILLAPAFNIYDCVKNKMFFGKPIEEGKDLHLWNMTFTKEYFLDISDESYYNLNPFTKVIIIHGSEDILVPISYSINLKEKYSNVSLRIIPNSDHEFIGFYDELIKEVGEALNE